MVEQFEMNRLYLKGYKCIFKGVEYTFKPNNETTFSKGKTPQMRNEWDITRIR